MSEKIAHHLLTGIAEEIRSSVSGLFEVNDEYQTTREKGHYAVFIVKPTQRMRSVLSVTREVVLIATTFTDQQPRTVTTAHDIIGRSAGRLEANFAIVFHKDPHGNHKLKDWGREKGMTILPVFAPGGTLPRSADLERVLCHELYSHDPFDVTGPVADDSQFFGRRAQAEDLARKLQTGQIRSYFGIRKIGKTSILNRVRNDCLRSHDCVCVMVDCSIDGLWRLSAGALIGSIAMAIRDARNSEARYAATIPRRDFQALDKGAAALMEAVRECDRPLVLFFDEIDYIMPGSPTAAHWKHEFNEFWRAVRAAYQEMAREGSKLSLLVCGVASKWFAEGEIEGVENAALAFVPEEYLSPLPRDASVQMIRKMGSQAGLQFAENAARYVAEACADMPFWIRKASSFVHRNLPVDGRPRAVKKEDLEGLVDDFIRRDGGAMAQVAVAHLIRVYPELKVVARACLDKRGGDQPAHLLRVLEKYGVVSADERRQAAGVMIAEGLRLYFEREDARADGHADSGPQGAEATDSLDQWAEDLAAISKQRNLVERRLREFAKGFIGFDSLSKPDKTPAVERVMRVASREKRDRLDKKSIDDVLAALDWKELGQLVEREWDLFEKLFGDKKEFQLHTTIVNDRPDAHAKAIDPGDVAMYRRSLKWIEDRLNRI